MNRDTPTLREVEELEAWFRTQCHDAAAPDTDAVRSAVRCALDEQWLCDQLSDDSPPGLEGKIKTRLQAELAAESGKAPDLAAIRDQKAGSRSRRYVLLRWSAGISAAAAAVALWFSRPVSPPGPSETGLDTGEFIAYAADDMDLALTELGEDIALLERGWRGRAAHLAPDGWYEEWINRVDHGGDQL